MRLNLRLFLMLLLCNFVVSNAISQPKTKRQPLPLVVYNSNVNAPLTSSELAKIQEVYGDQTESLILSKPQRLKDVKNILRNRMIYQQVNTGEALKDCPLLSTVHLFDYYVSNISRDVVFNKDTFNPLKYSFNFYTTGASMYKVDHTNYYIIIKSQYQ